MVGMNNMSDVIRVFVSGQRRVEVRQEASVVVAFPVDGKYKLSKWQRADRAVSHVEMELGGLVWALGRISEGSSVIVETMSWKVAGYVRRNGRASGTGEPVPIGLRDELRAAFVRHSLVGAVCRRRVTAPAALLEVRRRARVLIGMSDSDRRGLETGGKLELAS